jgi:hypothetical protein
MRRIRIKASQMTARWPKHGDAVAASGGSIRRNLHQKVVGVPGPRHGHRDRLALQERAIAAEIADHLHVRHELGIAPDQLGDRRG